MKIRTDFVTNSSSTSYCLIGADVEGLREKLQNKCQQLVAVYERRTGKKFKQFTDITNYGIEDLLGLIAPDLSIYYNDYDYDYGSIGLSIDNMRKHETLGDFEKRALEALQCLRVFGCEINKVRLIVDSTYD